MWEFPRDNWIIEMIKKDMEKQSILNRFFLYYKGRVEDDDRIMIFNDFFNYHAFSKVEKIGLFRIK